MKITTILRCLSKPNKIVTPQTGEVLDLRNALHHGDENIGVGVLLERLPLIYKERPRIFELNSTQNQTTFSGSESDKNNLSQSNLSFIDDHTTNTKSHYHSHNVDIHISQRNPESSIYMLTLSDSVTTHEWFPPGSLMRSQIPLSTAAMKIAKSMFLNEGRTRFNSLNNFVMASIIPFTYIKFTLPNDHPWKPSEPAVFFIFKLLTRNTKIKVNPKIVQDYCWLSLEEMRTHLNPKIFCRFEPFLK